VIEVEELTKRYADRTAVDAVSFQVGQGEVVGFLGPNGAGKTTTLRMITGYLAPTEGQIRVGGVDALADPIAARQRVGYMPEGVPLYPEMRTFEYLRHRAELKGVARREIKKAVERSLEQAGVSDAHDRIIGQLSKGYRQRVGLADALVADPPLLILDEPTSGLDPNQIRQVRSLVRNFAGEKTVFLSTHILPEVEASCERVVIIHDGRIVGQGPPDALRDADQGGQVVTLVARGEESRIRAAVETADGVRALEDVHGAGDGALRVRVQTEPGPGAAESISAAIAEAGLALRELRAEAASLEDVFAHLTTEDRGSVAEPPVAEPDDARQGAEEGP
jgi:ABC-2 type transport system ATP-binding protein